MIHRWWLLCCVALLASCAVTHPSATTSANIGPYTSFHGRMIVMTPSRRWQVSIVWQTEDAQRGHLRLLHAATGFVLEARWQQPDVEVRDSEYPQWRAVTLADMQQQGILLPPWEMAAILQGKVPVSLKQTGTHRWQGRVDGSLLRLEWRSGQRRLILTDITHGRRITLMIES